MLAGGAVVGGSLIDGDVVRWADLGWKGWMGQGFMDEYIYTWSNGKGFNERCDEEEMGAVGGWNGKGM